MLIIPWAIGVWNVIITRTYLQSTIPGELYEAARVDGASNTRMFWHIVLPLSGPIIAVITLFYAVNHWNTYFNALIYIRNDNLRPLQLILREILIQNSMNILDDMMADMSAEQLEQMTRREFLVAAAAIFADRGGHGAGSGDVSVRAEALRQGSDDRFDQGIA